MAGDCSSSYVPAHVMSRPVPGRLHRAARRRAAQRDDRTVAPGAMDRMRLIDRPEEPFPLILNSMRELQSLQAVLAKILRKARESNKRVKSLQLAIGEISELDPGFVLEHWDELTQGTPAEHAQLHFRSIKAEVQCMA